MTKANIAIGISKNLDISYKNSKKITDSFIRLIKNNVDTKEVKISGFGSFTTKISPERIGRNPKTKESYIIKPMKKVSFHASSKIKRIIN